MAAAKAKCRKARSKKATNGKPFIQGEGDYVSARRHQAEAHRFAREHDTQALARAAAPKNKSERREMAAAERKGKSRAKGSLAAEEKGKIALLRSPGRSQSP